MLLVSQSYVRLRVLNALGLLPCLNTKECHIKDGKHSSARNFASSFKSGKV